MREEMHADRHGGSKAQVVMRFANRGRGVEKGGPAGRDFGSPIHPASHLGPFASNGSGYVHFAARPANRPCVLGVGRQQLLLGKVPLRFW